jgi:ketosteroid isomerase-like protein
MSTKNKELVKKINDALSKGNTEFVIAHLADDITWNIVGMPAVNGKSEFLKTMKMMVIESFPDIAVKNIIAEGDYVVVESTGKNLDNSFCDIYHLKNEKIWELTTYIVDTSVNE